jgi:hypothetical protein
MSVTRETADPTTFSLRPAHKAKFHPQKVKSFVRSILVQKLQGQDYNHDNIQTVIKDIADTVRDKIVKEMGFSNYKILVHCLVSEQRGQGVRMASKCFWDADTDNVVEEIYMTKQLLGVVTVYGLYQY